MCTLELLVFVFKRNHMFIFPAFWVFMTVANCPPAMRRWVRLVARPLNVSPAGRAVRKRAGARYWASPSPFPQTKGCNSRRRAAWWYAFNQPNMVDARGASYKIVGNVQYLFVKLLAQELSIQPTAVMISEFEVKVGLLDDSIRVSERTQMCDTSQLLCALKKYWKVAIDFSTTIARTKLWK